MRLRMILADRSPALWSQFWSQLELPRPRFNTISRSSPPIRQARTSRVVRRRSLFDGTIKRPFDATFLDEEAVGSNPTPPDHCDVSGHRAQVSWDMVHGLGCGW